MGRQEGDRVLVIGAGPAGLATAVQLARARVPALVLERGEAVGWAWRRRYDRLRLNSSRCFSHLPGARYPRAAGVFPARDEVVRYLESYASRNDVELMLGIEVSRIDRDAGRWRVRSAAGDLHATHVVVASGFEHTPFVPEWPGRASFAAPLLHAAEYRNPQPFRGQDVLVVGPGSSGMEIAEDLAAGGARRVWLSVRRPPNLMLRTPLGALFGRLLMHVSPARGDRVARFVRRRSIGDLSAFGLPEPKEGVFTRVVREKVAPSLVDMSTIQAIKDGSIEIVAAVESLDARAVHLSDGSSLEPDAVIASTGYRLGLEPLVGHLGVLDTGGVPRATGAVPAAPGLRFVGFVPLPAQLGYLGKEARRASRAIARERAHPRAPVAVGQLTTQARGGTVL